jgi:hypothetical protein
MDSGPVQGFIGIDVSDSGQKMLVQEEGFDFPMPGSHPGREFRQGDFQRFGAQPREGTPFPCFPSLPEDPPKPAGIDEPELVPMLQEREDQVGVFFAGDFPGQDPQSSAHSQVNEHGSPAAQTEDDIFSPPLHSQDFLFLQQIGQRLLAPPQAFFLADLYPGEFPPHDAVPQPAHDRFHFRQLRHISSFPSIPDLHPAGIFLSLPTPHTNQKGWFANAGRSRGGIG